jgi:hypothetical protein
LGVVVRLVQILRAQLEETLFSTPSHQPVEDLVEEETRQVEMVDRAVDRVAAVLADRHCLVAQE